jgi:hypothetical protein
MSTPDTTSVLPPGSPKVRTNKEIREALNILLNALERLHATYRWDRILYLGIATLSFLLFLVAAGFAVAAKPGDTAMIGALLGTSGVVSAISARTTYFFDKGFKIVTDLATKLLDVREFR